MKRRLVHVVPDLSPTDRWDRIQHVCDSLAGDKQKTHLTSTCSHHMSAQVCVVLTVCVCCINEHREVLVVVLFSYFCVLFCIFNCIPFY